MRRACFKSAIRLSAGGNWGKEAVNMRLYRWCVLEIQSIEGSIGGVLHGDRELGPLSQLPLHDSRP
jgi:hypothetical protein